MHYVNSEESDDSNNGSNIKSKQKSRKDSDVSENNYSNVSDSNSEHNKMEKENALKKSVSNKKILSRNNNALGGFHIFSKETMVSEINKHKYNDKEINILKTLTIDSNEMSPRNPYFNEINN